MVGWFKDWWDWKKIHDQAVGLDAQGKALLRMQAYKKSKKRKPQKAPDD